MQREVLKYNPLFFRMNKNLYDENLFYQYQCHLPISKNEFITYLLTKPDRFVIFHQNTVDFYILFDRNLYTRIRSVVQREPLSITIKVTEKGVSLFKLINEEVMDNRQFDVTTTFNILKQRTQCMRFNPNYSKQQTIRLFKEHLRQYEATIDSFEEWVINQLYFYYNDLGDYPEEVSDNLFHINGQPLDLQELKDYVNVIAIYPDSINDILNSLG